MGPVLTGSREASEFLLCRRNHADLRRSWLCAAPRTKKTQGIHQLFELFRPLDGRSPPSINIGPRQFKKGQKVLPVSAFAGEEPVR